MAEFEEPKPSDAQDGGRRGGVFGIGSKTPAELELREAESEHKQAVKAAEKNLATLTKQWNGALADAQARLAQAQAHGTKLLNGYGGVTLYENAVVTPQGTINLEWEPATAAVDTAGGLAETRRATLTRMAAGGLLLGPVGLLGGGMLKKKGTIDTRELYLVVESASVASMVQCRPDDGPRVHQLANAINMAARSAPGLSAQRAELIPQCASYLEAITQQRAEALSQAATYLEFVRADTHRVEAAQRAVEAQSRS